MPGDASFALDIDRVRAAARSVPGDKPTSIEVEAGRGVHLPRDGSRRGRRLGRRPAARVLVPTDLSGQLHHRRHRVESRRWAAAQLTSFDAAAYGRMQAAMSAAKQIVITHEHMDHIGGLDGARRPRDRAAEGAAHARASCRIRERSLPAKFPDRRARRLSAARVRPVSRDRAGRRADQVAGSHAGQPDGVRADGERHRAAADRRRRLALPQHRAAARAGAAR